MFRRTVLSMIVLFLAFGAAIVYPHPLLSYAQSDGCASADYSTALHLLADSQTALNDSDVAQSVQLEAQARAELRRIFQDCAVTPMLHNMGFGQATIDEVAQMPFCEYRFEATVRSGPDAGLALNGTLALMQNSDTAAVGYVYSLDQTATAVPVLAELGDQNAVTLTFTLAADESIIGTGYLTANINSCFGGIEGVLTGPTSGDVGDWIGTSCTLNPSSASCTPSVSLDPSQLPILQPSNPAHPEKPSSNMCTPIRDAACQAACGTDFQCRLACPVVGETCP